MECEEKQRAKGSPKPAARSRTNHTVNIVFADIIYAMCWVVKSVLILAASLVALHVVVWFSLHLAGLV